MKTTSTAGRILGALEREVMTVLWGQKEPTTIRVVCDALVRKNVAYTTIMTVMNRLVEKGLLMRDERVQPHVYTPKHSEQEFFESVAGTMLDRIRREFGPLAIACFAEAAERLSRKRLKALRRLQKS